MSTLQKRLEQDKVREVYTLICVETGKWLSGYDLFDGTDDYGHRCFPAVGFQADNAGSCEFVESLTEAQHILRKATAYTGKKDGKTLCVVTIHLPR